MEYLELRHTQGPKSTYLSRRSPIGPLLMQDAGALLVTGFRFPFPLACWEFLLKDRMTAFQRQYLIVLSPVGKVMLASGGSVCDRQTGNGPFLAKEQALIHFPTLFSYHGAWFAPPLA